MPNKKKINSTARELRLRNEYQDKGYYALRSPSSLGVADVIAIRPSHCNHCPDPNHFEVKFIQVKTSQKIHVKKVVPKAEEVNFGFINVEYHYFPVKNAAWREMNKDKKEKEKIKKKKTKVLRR